MLNKLDHQKMGTSNLGWLKSIFHFSFAEYYNPKNMNFGVLRVINDDLIEPKKGFDTHPHQDMEIISYVVDGQLTHGDSMGNKQTLERGQVQYMSAGTGIYHSEYNLGDSVARFLQIWILPDQKGHTPQYVDYRFDWSDRHNKWLHLVSGNGGAAPIHINQDVNLYVVEIEQGQVIDFSLSEGRQVYLVQIEGESAINGLTLSQRDALEVSGEDIVIQAQEKSHILLVEMKQE